MPSVETEYEIGDEVVLIGVLKSRAGGFDSGPIDRSFPVRAILIEAESSTSNVPRSAEYLVDRTYRTSDQIIAKKDAKKYATRFLAKRIALIAESV